MAYFDSSFQKSIALWKCEVTAMRSSVRPLALLAGLRPKMPAPHADSTVYFNYYTFNSLSLFWFWFLIFNQRTRFFTAPRLHFSLLQMTLCCHWIRARMFSLFYWICQQHLIPLTIPCCWHDCRNRLNHGHFKQISYVVCVCCCLLIL